MKIFRISLIAIFLFSLLFSGHARSLPARAAPQAMQIWVEHIANKVQPTTAPGAASSITLEGARDSYAAVQIVVRASGSALAGVNMSATVLSDGSGHSLPAANITFYRQHFINFTGVSEAEPGSRPVPENSPTSDPWLPDPLIPFLDPYDGSPAGAPFGVTADRNQPVWVDFHIPANATPGTYTGQITVSANGQPNSIVPVTLTVWNLLLPDKNVVTTYFQAHFDEVIKYHRDTYEGDPANPWRKYDAYTRQLVKRYEELIHTHRLDTWMDITAQPEAADSCAVPTDWSDYDAAVQPYMDGTYWSDGVPNAWIDTPFTPGVDWGPEGDCSQTEYTALAAAWASHLTTQGWFDNAIVYAYDEPPAEVFPVIAQHSSWMQAGKPGWKAHIMDTTEPEPGNVAILNPALGIYTVCLRCYDHWYQGDSYGRAEWPGLFSQGIQLWFYESNAQSNPYPTFATNTLWGVEPLIVLWGSWYEHASGFLYWDMMMWDDDTATGGPWGPNVDFGKTGDGVLLYPGHHDGFLAPMGSPSDVTIDGPIPSYRLKLVRAGLQDWALFKLAEQLGQGDYARDQVARVYGQFGGCEWGGCPEPENGSFFWLANPALMDEVRHNIAMRLSVNLAPNTPSNPQPANGASNVFTNEILSWQGGDPNGDPAFLKSTNDG